EDVADDHASMHVVARARIARGGACVVEVFEVAARADVERDARRDRGESDACEDEARGWDGRGGLRKLRGDESVLLALADHHAGAHRARVSALDPNDVRARIHWNGRAVEPLGDELVVDERADVDEVRPARARAENE